MAERKMDKSSLELGELPSNSLKSKQVAENKVDGPTDIQKVTKGNVKIQKKPAGKRFLESIGVEDGRTVGDYILWDVILPSAKDMLSSVVKNGIDVFLYGQVKPKNIERRGRTSRVSYDRYYDDDRYILRSRDRSYSYRPRAAMDFSNIVFDDRLDAEKVLDEMADIMQQYGFVRVSDFLAMSGVDDSDISHADHNLGWERLINVSVERVRDGYVINLPRPVPFD